MGDGCVGYADSLRLGGGRPGGGAARPKDTIERARTPGTAGGCSPRAARVLPVAALPAGGCSPCRLPCLPAWTIHTAVLVPIASYGSNDR